MNFPQELQRKYYEFIVSLTVIVLAILFENYNHGELLLPSIINPDFPS